MISSKIAVGEKYPYWQIFATYYIL